MANRWFWTFFERCFDRPEYWMSAICIAKLKYWILSEVCMIKTVPHSTVSPQMWYINGMKGWFTSTQICWQDFVKLSCLTQNSAWFFPGLINLRWWKATMDLKCDRRLLLFWGVHMRLSTRGKIWFTLGLFYAKIILRDLLKLTKQFCKGKRQERIMEQRSKHPV